MVVLTFSVALLVYNIIVHYVDVERSGLANTTGYVSADLQLMTLDYQLFEDLPFNFCGDFIKRSMYNFNTCPEDGKYHFEVPYTLPPNEDQTSWFATGWRGTSYLTIGAGPASDNNSTLLAHCKLEFETSVTQSQESGWSTLPSASQTTLVLVGVVAFLVLTVFCLACRPAHKHVTDEAYESEFKALEDDFNKTSRQKGEKNKNKKKTTGDLKSQVEQDWSPQEDPDWAADTPKAKAHRAALMLKEGP
jgi:hypothetical protein